MAERDESFVLMLVPSPTYLMRPAARVVTVRITQRRGRSRPLQQRGGVGETQRRAVTSRMY